MLYLMQERRLQVLETKLAKIPKVSGDAGQVYLDSNTAKVLDGMHHLVEICTRGYDQSVSDSWLEAIELFRSWTGMQSSHFILEYEDVCEYQLEVDKFLNIYMALFAEGTG